MRGKNGSIEGVQIADALGNLSVMPAQIVISAWGFRNNPLPGLEKLVKFNPDDTIKTDKHMYAGEKIFAAGDAVLGADLVTNAIAQGRYAAEKMIEFIILNQEDK